MRLISKATDKKFWQETVRHGRCYESFIKNRLEIWERDCEGKAIPELKYSAFKLFKATGNRNVYEDVYFMRRRNMAAAAHLSLIFPEEEKYITYLQDIIFSTLDEYTWCLPAHNTALERNNQVNLDLFATETGFALSEIYHMLGDRLEPLIRLRIVSEINRRIFDSFFAGVEGTGKQFWWATTATNNWTAVCMGSIGCTCMLMRPDLFDRLKPDLDRCMENFLCGYGEDGYCLEGVHYWHYGFGFFTVYAQMLREFTLGKEDYFKRPKVRAISSFIQKMFLTGSSAVSFADGECELEFHTGLCHFLKSEYPEEVKVYSPKYSYIEDGCSRFCLVTRAATWLNEDYYNNPSPDNAPCEYYGKQSQWYIKRTESYGFAAKAGNNDEHHNHNDIGSFIFAKDGKQLLADMGRGEYTRQYFRNETRYGIIECRSLGHSVPHFGSCEQKFGKQYASREVSLNDGVFTMDIADAYGLDALKSLKRTFTVSDGEVVLHDSFVYDGDEPIIERIVLTERPTLSDGKITVGNATVEYDATKSACTVSEQTTTTVSISDQLALTNKTVFMLDFTLNEGVREFTAKIR